MYRPPALQDRAQLAWLRWSIMTDMAISLLYFDGCSNWHVADERLHAALVAVGRPDDEVGHVLVSTPEEAEAAQFPGVPNRAGGWPGSVR